MRLIDADALIKRCMNGIDNEFIGIVNEIPTIDTKPLDKVIEDIKADIEKAMEDFYYDEHDLGVRAGFRFALEIIGNYEKGESE